MRWMLLLVMLAVGCSEGPSANPDVGGGDDCRPAVCRSDCWARGSYWSGACASCSDTWLMDSCCLCISEGFDGMVFAEDPFGQCGFCGALP